MAEQARARYRLSDTLVSVVFIAVLVVPSVDLFFGIDKTPMSDRREIGMPEWPDDASGLGRYAGDLRYFLMNRFGFEGAMVRAHGLVKHDVLGVSPSMRVIMGSDGWYFLDLYRGNVDPAGYRRFADEGVERWRAAIEGRRAWLAERDVAYLFMVAPDKATVYTEYLPPAYRGLAEATRLALLTEEMMRSDGAGYLDLAGVLREAKDRGRLYHKTDTHWNELGAYEAYRAIAGVLSGRWPGLVPIERDRLVVREEAGSGGDHARLMGLKDDLSEGRFYTSVAGAVAHESEPEGPLRYDTIDVGGREYVRTVSERGEIGRAVILRDSFGDLLVPYLSEHFREAVWVWTDEFDEGVIEGFEPDVVIQEIVERKLLTHEPKMPGVR